MNLWAGARELYLALRDYEGDRAYDDLIVPWLDEGAEAYRNVLAPLAEYGRVPGGVDRSDYWLAIPYALSRVSDVLSLGFQPEPDPDVATPWAHTLHLVSHTWPAISRDDYLASFTRLGMTPIGGSAGFDPFFHEIVEVEQAADATEEIVITDLVWPGLMLGQMLFSRAGVRVRAGADRAQRGVADRSPLYECFLRRHRPTIDGSLGWGHNSQWDTDFRRDYRTEEGAYLNVDGVGDIASDRIEMGPDDVLELDDELLLTLDERRELLRNRCLLREPGAVLTLDRESPHWRTNLLIDEWTLAIPDTAGR